MQVEEVQSNRGNQLVMTKSSQVHEHFLTLLKSTQRQLHKVCWVYGRSTHDREDLFQEIVAQLWRSFARYDRTRSFATWMYRVALNVAIDHRRKRQRLGKGLTPLDENQAAETASSINDSQGEQLQELRELMDQQEEGSRALLFLYLEGHSLRDIGEVLGLSETNVSTRLHRLKQSMRQTIQQSSKQQGA